MGNLPFGVYIMRDQNNENVQKQQNKLLPLKDISVRGL